MRTPWLFYVVEDNNLATVILRNNEQRRWQFFNIMLIKITWTNVSVVDFLCITVRAVSQLIGLANIIGMECIAAVGFR